MDVLEARKRLGLSQREMIAYAKTVRIELTQTSLSNMENGKCAVIPLYGRWLGFLVVGKYKRIADMPVGILAECIRNRSEI